MPRRFRFGLRGVLAVLLQLPVMATAELTVIYDSGNTRPYRYGYGHVDINLNGVVDKGERKVYFEVSDFATPYVFYENYR